MYSNPRWFPSGIVPFSQPHGKRACGNYELLVKGPKLLPHLDPFGYLFLLQGL